MSQSGDVSGYVKGSRRKATETMAKTRAQELTELFYKTPEMQECKQIAGTVNGRLDPDDTVPVTLAVPKEFIRLTDFLEQKRAGEAGVTPRPADKVLNQIMLNELHEQLHWLVVEPAHFGYFRNLWNRFCDQEGAPEEKIADPASGPATGGEEGPF